MTKRPIVTVADAIIECLENFDVECVFGLPGSQNTAIFESLRQSQIRTILATSETAAGFMANGWFRAVGRPGVFIATEGPGFAWSIPPIAEAMLDSSAVLLITGKPAESDHDFDAIAQGRIASAMGASVFDIDDSKAVIETVRSAWNRLTECGPAPVVIQISEQALSSDWTGASGALTTIKNKSKRDDGSALIEALTAIADSKRPVLFAGAGCLEHAAQLKQLVESWKIPCITTPTARGVISESHQLCVSTDLFFADVDSTNAFIDSSDLIIALGCRLSRNGTIGFGLVLEEKKLIHVDANPKVFGRSYPARCAVCADVGAFLTAALSRLNGQSETIGFGWEATETATWRNLLQSKQHGLPMQPLWTDHGTCDLLFREVATAIPEHGIVVTDTGFHQLLVRTHLDALSPRGLIFPSDFQSMGFGLPAAIGSALAVPERPVIAIIGDGSFLMVGTELLTAKREQISLPVLVFCDNSLGLIRNQQIQDYGRDSATKLEANDLKEFAKWLGIPYELAAGSLNEQIRTALGRNSPTLIEVRLEDNPDLARIGRKAMLKKSLKSTLGSRAVRLLRSLMR